MFAPQKFLTRKILIVLFVGLLGFLQQPSTLAQEDDLSLPGDEQKVTTPVEDEGKTEENTSAFGLILEGGWAMIPLFAMLFALIALAVFLFMDLTPKNFNPPELVAQLDQHFSEANLEAVLQTSETSPTCLGQVAHGATEYIWERGYEVLDHDTIFDLMADASQEFNRKRATIINWFSVISQSAPMVGLLGTVSGMIKAFGTLKSEGMGDPGQLAGNISEALVTTASGLIIAIPAIFFYFFFRDKLTAHVAAVEKNLGRMLNALRRAVYNPQEQGYGDLAGTVDPNYGSVTPPPPPPEA